jgi:hypothetical protein
MAIRPDDFTNHEMRLICLVALQAGLGAEIHAKLERILAIATSTRADFFIGSYASPEIERTHGSE